jgi:hypothetical protein
MGSYLIKTFGENILENFSYAGLDIWEGVLIIGIMKPLRGYCE